MNKSIVDETWTCECGAWNAGYLSNCGNCDRPKTK